MQLNDKIDLNLVENTEKQFQESDVILQTTLTESKQLSEFYKANIYLKREDLQKGNNIYDGFR
jgi:threonine dehydratase